MNRNVIFLTLLIGIWACSEQDSTMGKTEPKVVGAAPAEPEKVADIEQPATYARGKSSYHTICAACHMPTGQGVPGLNPPLVGTEWVMGDKVRLIGIVLNGFNEEIEIDGDRYANEMAALDYLSDEEIANILTYVRFEFGRRSNNVTIEEVAAVRAAGS